MNPAWQGRIPDLNCQHPFRCFHHRLPIAAGLSRRGPSFPIPGAGGGGSGSSVYALPLDRINSGELIRLARSVYYRFLASASGASDPLGVVLTVEQGHGRVVFDRPVLLIDEHFVPVELLRNRSVPRSRSIRNPSSRSSSQASGRTPPASAAPESESGSGPAPTATGPEGSEA